MFLDKIGKRQIIIKSVKKHKKRNIQFKNVNTTKFLMPTLCLTALNV